MLKVAVLGADTLVKYILALNQSDKYELVGFYDANTSYAKQVAEEFGYNYIDSIDTLINLCDVVDIVTPTLSHYECAKKAIENKKHVFIEKPITNTVAEAEELLSLIDTFNVKGQVGHVERFNPAFMGVKDNISNPMFIETHRLAEFNPRGTDVPVVLDLTHDIDLVLSIVKSPVKSVSASST